MLKTEKIYSKDINIENIINSFLDSELEAIIQKELNIKKSKTGGTKHNDKPKTSLRNIH